MMFVVADVVTITSGLPPASPLERASRIVGDGSTFSHDVAARLAQKFNAHLECGGTIEMGVDLRATNFRIIASNDPEAEVLQSSSRGRTQWCRRPNVRCLTNGEFRDRDTRRTTRNDRFDMAWLNDMTWLREAVL